MTKAKLRIDPIFVMRFYIDKALEQRQEKSDWRKLAYLWDKVRALEDKKLEKTMLQYEQHHTKDGVFIFEPEDFEIISNQILDSLIGNS